jgi:hypothetical protein
MELLKEWVEENTSYYEDEKDDLDPTKQRLEVRPQYIPLEVVAELLKKAVAHD